MRPAGRVVVAAVASSNTVSIATAVSSSDGLPDQAIDRGVQCSAISLVNVEITAIFFGVKVIAANAPCRTGIGAPWATKLPAIVGVLERVGMLTMPARPNENFRLSPPMIG